MVPLIIFALSFLWSVVECCGQNGHCHGQLDEQPLLFFLSGAQASCLFVYVECSLSLKSLLDKNGCKVSQ
jgi:hypothetical protein